MAHIDYKDGLFYGLGAWAERDLFKTAGFAWSPLRKAWITKRLEVAESIAGLTWTQRAIDHIDHRLKVAEVSRQMSYQADSDFDPPIPHALLAKGIDFKPFQKAGIEFATMRRDTLIADQPGLGKTIQAIGVSNCYPKRRRVLVVTPASLKENWRREWLKWCSKGLSVGIAETQHREKIADGIIKSGKNKGKPRYRTVVHPRWWPDTDVVIINYDILDKFSAEIHAHVWDILICDECHALKSTDSGRTLFVLGGSRLEHIKDEDGKRLTNRDGTPSKKKQKVWFKTIDAARRLFLSGTPMMNRPIELWPIVQAFDPEGLGRDYNDYAYRYCGAWWDSARGKNGALDVSGATNLKELGAKLREVFMVRRLKREVLPELPDKFRQVVTLESKEISEVVAREDELAQALKLYEANILGMVDGEAMAGAQIVEAVYKMGFHKAVGEDGDPDRPDSRKLNLSYAASVLGLEPPAIQIMFEEMAAIRRELGIAKLSAIVPWVKNFLDGGEKLILFAYHSDVVLALAEQLADYNPAVIYGGTPVKKRQGQVDKFQEDESCRIIICNIQAGGVGYTMTRAADVAFAEGDWVPTLLEQCEDRSCRIGQLAEKIMVFFLVANGSLDARIAQAALAKEENISEVLDT